MYRQKIGNYALYNLNIHRRRLDKDIMRQKEQIYYTRKER